MKKIPEIVITVDALKEMQPAVAGTSQGIKAMNVRPKGINFTIEPPLEINDHVILSTVFKAAVERQVERVGEVEPFYENLNLLSPVSTLFMSSGMWVTDSDEQATHGRFVLRHTSPSEQAMQEFIGSVFQDAFSLLGKVALSVNFVPRDPGSTAAT